VCVTRHDHVSVRFSCSGLQRAKFQGRTVFAAPLPTSVYRPQRREFFRVATPIYNPLRIRIPQPQGDPLDLMVVDLSCGGVGIYDPQESLKAQPGDAIAGCGLELPGFGRFVCDLEVRNMVRVRRADGDEVKRIGCQFKGLAMDANALIQRYLHKLQLEAKR
jgi:c-di-GMP-binding flagellar brake protein YcgR